MPDETTDAPPEGWVNKAQQERDARVKARTEPKAPAKKAATRTRKKD